MSNIDNIINKIGKNPVVRDFGLYENYEPETTHKNTVYLATDRRKIYLNGKEYGSGTLDESVIEEFNSQLNNKVDKIEGKQLSTEDFTTILKQKLDELNNYDDAALSAKIDDLKNQLDTLVNKNANEIIDTFNEIEEFLQGVTNTQTLVGLLQEMKSEIMQSCTDTYLPTTSYTANDVLNKVKSVDGANSGLDADLLDGKHNGELTASVLKGADAGDVTTVSGRGTVSYVYGRPSNTEGLFPVINNANSILTLNRHDGNFYSQLGFNSNNGIYYRCFHNVAPNTTTPWKQLAFTDTPVELAQKLKVEYLSADVVDLNDYKGENFSYGRRNYTGSSDNHHLNKPAGVTGYYLDVFVVSSIPCQILTDFNGRMYKRVYKLSAWTDWVELATTDSNVASADKLTTKQLTNEDLNTLTIEGTVYNGSYGNTCANKPNNVGVFALSIFKENNLTIQVLYSDTNIYIRNYQGNSVWSNWKKILTEEDILSGSRDGQILSRNSSGFKWIDVNSAFSGMESLLAYGVEWDVNVSDPHLTRIGNMSLHKTLPIQSQMRGCVAQGEKIMYFLDEDDWSKKEDGSASRLDGYDGTVRVYIPSFYIKSESDGTKRRVWISTVKIDDTWEHQPESLIDAYQCTVLNTVPTNMGYLSTLPVNSAISVVNTNTYCRGGGNRSANDTYLTSDPYKSDLGKQRTSISRSTMRTYARNAGSEMLNYYQYKNIFYWLYVIEYANFNCQEAFNESLTSEGYHQGGMGSGVTNWSWNGWNAYNGVYPIIPCGYTNNLGNKSGIKEVTINGTKMYVPRWRCFENFFGHIWTNLEGIIIDANAEGRNNMNYVYACADHTKYSDSLTSDYKKIGEEIHTDGYIKEFDLGSAAHIIPASVGGNTTLNKCDYHYTGEKNATLRTLLFGGSVASGSSAGVGCFLSSDAVSYSTTAVGFRSASSVSSASA